MKDDIEQKMSVLFYMPVAHGAAKRLREAIKVSIPEGKLEMYRTIDNFERRLRGPMHNVAAAVLLAISRDAFSEILSVSGLLHDVRIILILPDRKAETVAKGHTLYPRFVAYADSDLTDVVAVLGKILGSYNLLGLANKKGGFKK